MDPIDPKAAAPALTPAQRKALGKLHDAATQLEGVFVGMLFKEMHANKPETDIFGKVSNAENTWNDMLDEKRADAIAKSGSFGIAKMVESQLRNSVLASAATPPAGAAAPPAVAPVTIPPPLPSAAEPLPGGE
jgi:Rod binding domain-containing protein